MLRFLRDCLPEGATVLDAGCGSGHPVGRLLAKSVRFIGVDFSDQQIRTAKKMVPRGEFVCADITHLPFRIDSFDGVCSYYAIIHVPRDEHRKLMLDLVRVLRPAGLALLCLGAGDLPSDISEYHGSPMFWSHYDAETNLSMVKETGLSLLWSKMIKDPIDPASSHLFVLAKKNGRSD